MNLIFINIMEKQVSIREAGALLVIINDALTRILMCIQYIIH